ncbi:type II toxin-antitoxin system RelB/DinJ family antitoxin [Exercitatus varius]|uniref:type II toxin-antitoxin system RelB/DinJ family antitoxin n=1 Tax=Exercitatus varius TaxID=67857 RepID=UPI00294AA350|nr:type II toxin-antitoxin system RelB/DinJ family antitoxin [Exercitatus varius]MDG2961690.1 type II toxin-antitoxin system RelB/DinJ family antitoxin [Exercitatus varius]
MAMIETYVRARIDSAIKQEATEALHAMGMNMSDFIRIALTRVAKEKAIPFNIQVPNSTTVAAIHEARNILANPNHHKAFTQIEKLFSELESKK